VQAAAGDFSRVRIVRPGTRTVIGTVVFFAEGEVDLSEQSAVVLLQQGPVFQGKPQKIEIRGHTSLRPIDSGAEVADHWDLAFRRCRNTMRYLVDELQIDSQRIRMSVAGPNEPIHIGTDETKKRRNPRVEVFLLDEVVSDLVGTPDEQQQRFLESDE
jgi:chemotaxis protein MotB